MHEIVVSKSFTDVSAIARRTSQTPWPCQLALIRGADIQLKRCQAPLMRVSILHLD